jgi:circadian clock protein KaiC
MTAEKKIAPLEKCPTGIRGLDDITREACHGDGPPWSAAAAGCGKTLLAWNSSSAAFANSTSRGSSCRSRRRSEELARTSPRWVRSAGLIRSKKLAMDYVRVERSEIEVTGEYDLEGLFVRLGNSMIVVGAKRVGIDSLEALFAGLPTRRSSAPSCAGSSAG